MNNTNNLRDKIAKLQKELTESKNRLSTIVSTCQHQYGKPIYDPVHTEAYTIPGDPPGTMGVDWRGPVHVPAKTEEKWKRICELCGHIQYTEKTKPVANEPDFGGRL